MRPYWYSKNTYPLSFEQRQKVREALNWTAEEFCPGGPETKMEIVVELRTPFASDDKEPLRRKCACGQEHDRTGW